MEKIRQRILHANILRVFLLTFLTVTLPCVKSSAEVITGSCGENLSYTLDTETGLLNISGDGRMADYDYFRNKVSPWDPYKNLITEVEIGNSVTSIGKYAFYQCKNLTSVSIPNSVTSIGYAAFNGCSNLTSVSIPNSVTSIGDDAFNMCSSLTSVSIPNSVTSIGNGAFFFCRSLPSITIPDGVSKIGSSTFSGCTGLTSVTIPGSVITIGESAFSRCEALTNISIPNGVESVGRNAFYECKGLIQVTISPSLSSIGEGAFEGCTNVKELIYEDGCRNAIKTNITSVERLVVPNSLTNVGNNYWMSSLKEVVVSCKDMDDFYTYIERLDIYKIFYCSGEWDTTHSIMIAGQELNSIDIPNSTKTIVPYVFAKCSRLASVEIPNSVTSIDKHAFEGCSSLSSVDIPHSVTTVGEYAFANSGLMSVTIPYTMTAIGNCAFDCDAKELVYEEGCTKALRTGMTKMEKVVIASTITSMALDQFSRLATFTNCNKVKQLVYANGCVTTIRTGITSIEEVVIPNTVTSIEKLAFSGCRNLKSVSIPNSVINIEAGAFSDTGLETVVIPNSVTELGTAFQGCNSLHTAIIGTGVTKIDNSTFTKESYYGRSEGISLLIYEYGRKTIPYYCPKGEIGCIVIPNSVTDIELDDFGYNKVIVYSVYVNCKDENDFANYLSRTDIHDIFYKGSYEDYYVEHGIMINGEKQYTINIPESLTTIEDFSFSRCSDLTSVTIPNSVASIGDYVFKGCTGLTSVTIPNSVTDIGYMAFAGCSGLTSVTISSNTTINQEDFVFSGCDNVKELIYADGSTTASRVGLTKIEKVTIPNSVTRIEDYAFYECYSLASVSLPDGVTSIGERAFSDCWELASINLPDKLKSIGASAFEKCYELTSAISLPEGMTSIEVGVFYSCEGLTSVIIPNSITSIGAAAFDNCSGLTSITIPAGVTNIGPGAFYNCYRMQDVICLASNAPSIEADTFGSGSGVFTSNSIYEQATLHIPKGAKSSYTKATGWQKFWHVSEDIHSTCTINTSETGFATFYCSERAYKLPNHLSAQVVTACTDGILTYETIAVGNEEGVIPKGTAVLLVNDQKNAATFELIPSESTITYSGTNYLDGSDDATTTSTSGTNYYYKLTYGEWPNEDVFGWYWGENNGAAFSIESHKAWLALPKSQTSRSSFVVDENMITAVGSVEKDIDNEVCYDLKGRRVSRSTTSGLYIENGKKVFKK